MTRGGAARPLAGGRMHRVRKARVPLFAFEHRSDPLLPFDQFIRRMLLNSLMAGVLVMVCLLIGVVGYHRLGGLDWLDSLVNASMILGGMGPVDPIRTTAGKIFESAYALFSGVAFLTGVSLFLAPALHRLLHQLHLEFDDGK
jgi:hypothetical protein